MRTEQEIIEAIELKEKEREKLERLHEKAKEEDTKFSFYISGALVTLDRQIKTLKWVLEEIDEL